MSSGRSPSSPAEPLVSVIVLNYNGARWLERCLESLRAQTIGDQLEVIVADNLSSDGSDRLAQQIIERWPRSLFLQHGQNLGYCEGNNRAAARARPIPFLSEQ
jgi:GT2 family glycosyltransferase